MESESGPRGPLVLVIDDSKTIRRILEVCLDREGFRVISYGDPLEALRAIKTLSTIVPNIAFIDMGLPGLNGYQVMQYLKARPQWQKTTIIAISGRDGVFDRLKVRLAGAKEYVSKPFKKREIVALVQKYAPGDCESNQDA